MGEAQVVVRFALDANGVLEVTALDKKTRAANSCRINDACKSLDAATIRRMVEEAEAAKSHDADYAKKLEVKNALEEASYDLPEDECEELVQWLAECSLEATSLSVLERKLSQIKAKL